MRSNLRTLLIWLGVGVNLLNIAFVIFGLLLTILNGQEIKTLDFNSLGPIFLTFSISIVGALIIARQPENLMGWIYSAIGFFQGFSWFGSAYATYTLITHPGGLPGGDMMSVFSGFAWAPGLSIFLTYAILLYPTGRLPSRRWRIVAWASLVPILSVTFLIFIFLPHGGRALLESQNAQPAWLTPENDWLITVFNLTFPWMLVCGVASLASLVVRYFHSQSIERQQIKWFACAAALFFAILVFVDFFTAFQMPEWLIWVLAALAGFSVPTATAIAILRYHLWDIDLIIRRTLVYGGLTLTLALIYFGSVLMLQSLLEVLTGESQSPIVIVISTLGIAALFNPLRRRIQNDIDRRFYRRKYDADKMLEAFAANLRQEVDLDEISRSLLAVATESMQPKLVSLWIKPERDSQN